MDIKHFAQRTVQIGFKTCLNFDAINLETCFELHNISIQQSTDFPANIQIDWPKLNDTTHTTYFFACNK